MDIKIPEVGESIHEALIANWLKADGATVRTDEVICELETDKINVEITAEVSGTLHIKEEAGQTLPLGTVIGTIEEGAVEEKSSEGGESASPEKGAEAVTTKRAAEPGSAANDQKEGSSRPKSETSSDQRKSEAAVNPAAARLAKEKGIELDSLSGSGRDGRILVDDVMAAEKENKAKAGPPDQSAEKQKAVSDQDPGKDKAPAAAQVSAEQRPITRQAMSPIRQKIAQRLLKARQQTAMLTTFNEADLGHVIGLRKKHQEQFQKRHGIKLGLMSFFVKACIESLKEYPAVNGRIDGSDIVYHNYYDIGIAVGTERGLVVPVLRNADRLTFAEIEKIIAELGKKARDKKLTLSDLEGGTFTISNGGIYGSMLSTPILNTPQCGVLGMHAIQDRAVVRDGDIVIRPMMYLALSYDHQLIDGREAVGFLKLIKDYIEDPEELLLEL